MPSCPFYHFAMCYKLNNGVNNDKAKKCSLSLLSTAYLVGEIFVKWAKVQICCKIDSDKNRPDHLMYKVTKVPLRRKSITKEGLGKSGSSI